MSMRDIAQLAQHKPNVCDVVLGTVSCHNPSQQVGAARGSAHAVACFKRWRWYDVCFPNQPMNDVTQILQQIETGDPSAAEQLLPLVYEELRKMAAAKMAHESPDHTLQATALVHEAYVRLVDSDRAQHWNSRGHFFSAAAESMRRILVEYARHRQRLKHGGEFAEVDLDSDASESKNDSVVLYVSDSLEALAVQSAQAAELVKLRFFAGFSLPQAAEMLGVSSRTADRLWAYAKAWLHRELHA